MGIGPEDLAEVDMTSLERLALLVGWMGKLSPVSKGEARCVMTGGQKNALDSGRACIVQRVVLSWIRATTKFGARDFSGSSFSPHWIRYSAGVIVYEMMMTSERMAS